MEAALRRVVAAALGEDLGPAGDVTTAACVPPRAEGRAEVVARAAGVVAGVAALAETYRQVDERVAVTLRRRDGDRVGAGTVLAVVTGPLGAIITGERTGLNLVAHLSGVATTTRAFADAVAATACVVRDTRKTTPGLRELEKAAVVAGGGHNHRLRLDDALLVKDNHVAAAGGIAAATAAALAAAGGRPVQVEVADQDQALAAVAAGATDLLVDNATPAEVAAVVAAVGGRARVEASGGITLDTVAAYAAAGADRVAVGALTHSAAWLDVALDVVVEGS